MDSMDQIALGMLVNKFNKELELWEDEWGMRANFGFRYYANGRKYMHILDSAEVKIPPPVEAVEAAGKIVSEASDGPVESK